MIKKEENKLNVIDLFCGAGGMSYGFEKAGFNILLGVDSNKTSIKTFELNHKNSNVLCGDIRGISASEIKKMIGSKKVDIIIGGPPCQGFSMAGRRVPNDPRNSLFREYLRIVRELKPKIFVMENVRGLLSMKNNNGEKVIDVIIQEFTKIKYKTKCYKVNTADYGVPQRRQRIFIIGTRRINDFIFTEPTHHKYGVARLKKWNTVKGLLLSKNEINKKYFYSKKLIKGFKRREKENKIKKVGYGWQFLKMNEPSYTISARYWKDGAEALIKYNEQDIRMLTPKECAVIQSFPHSFNFSGNEREIYTQIGNAVPPKMAEVIAKSIKKVLQ